MARFQSINEEHHRLAVDISAWQGNVDFDTMAGKDPAGVILRAYGSDHSGGGDVRMKEYADALKARGIPVGSYFYCWIDNVDDLTSARHQADLYIDKLYDVFGYGNTGDLIPMLDLEGNAGVARTPTSGIRHENLDTFKMLRWANEFRNYFEYRSGTKLGLYTAHYFVDEQHNNFLGDENPLKDMPLWIAAFTKYGYSLETGLTKVGGWDRWIGWQFSENGNGSEWGVESTDIDLNYFEPIEQWTPSYYKPTNESEVENMATPRRTHGITRNTMHNFLVDAGAVFLNYGKESEKILGATRGGNSFVVEQEIKVIEIDGAKGALKGGRRVIESTARISCNLIEVTTQNLMLALAGADATQTSNTGGTGTTHDEIRRTRELGENDYIENIAIVGKIAGTGENFIGIIYNAMADEGLEINTEDKEEAVLEVTFTAHFDPEDMDSEPWAIRNPKRMES